MNGPMGRYGLCTMVFFVADFSLCSEYGRMVDEICCSSWYGRITDMAGICACGFGKHNSRL